MSYTWSQIARRFMDYGPATVYESIDAAATAQGSNPNIGVGTLAIIAKELESIRKLLEIVWHEESQKKERYIEIEIADWEGRQLGSFDGHRRMRCWCRHWLRKKLDWLYDYHDEEHWTSQKATWLPPPPADAKLRVKWDAWMQERRRRRRRKAAAEKRKA